MTRNQLTYHANKEIERANRAKERENYRHNFVTEQETHRNNRMNENLAWTNAAVNAAGTVMGKGGLSSYGSKYAPTSKTTVTRTKFLRSDQLPNDYTEVSEVLSNVR